MKVGFIGLGTMGSGMVKNLLRNSHDVIAYNRTREKALSIVDEKFTVAGSPMEIPGKAEIIFTMVSDDPALEEVLFGKKGLFETLSDKNVLVDSSTVSVELTEKISRVCSARKISFLDAPVTGSMAGAENGTLMFMVGGDREVLNRHERVLFAMGKRIVYCGGNTMGQKAKLALNLAQAMILESYLESITLALKEGVPRAAILEILENSGAKNNVSSFKVPFIIKRDSAPHFKLSLMKKDLKLAADEIGRLGLRLPLQEKILGVYEAAQELGLSGEDFSSTAKVLEKKNNISLGP